MDRENKSSKRNKEEPNARKRKNLSGNLNPSSPKGMTLKENVAGEASDDSKGQSAFQIQVCITEKWQWSSSACDSNDTNMIGCRNTDLFINISDFQNKDIHDDDDDGLSLANQSTQYSTIWQSNGARNC
jgi:hypothetical protein